MNSASRTILALDVGEKRIGAAWGDTAIRVVSPLKALEMGDDTIEAIGKLQRSIGVALIIVGLPRNQRGEETRQTEYVYGFAKKLDVLGVPVKFQDESLTSVLAEERLVARKKPYNKEDIDSEAAAIILTDYLESNYAK